MTDEPTNSELTTSQSDKDELISELPDTCDYCGAKMDRRLYFCPACAKPYRPVEQVIPKPAVPYEDDEMRLRVGGKEAWNVFFIYLIVIFISSMVAASIWGMDDMEPMMMLADIAIAVTTVVFTIRYWGHLKPLFTNILGFFNPWSFACFAILAPLLLLNYAYHDTLVGWLDIEMEDYNDYFSSRLGAIVVICVMPAITEEIAFRGIIQTQFERVVSTRLALIMASIVFSAAHFSLLSAPYLALAGLLFGWMKLKTNSIYPPMVAHFIHNYVVITYF